MSVLPLRPVSLLDHADELAYRDVSNPGRPTNVRLRRAVSAAYYGLYHAVVDAASMVLVDDVEHARRLSRSFQHDALRTASTWVTVGGGSPLHTRLMVEAARRSPSVVIVSESLLHLREARHAADYDHFAVITKSRSLADIAIARAAVAEVEATSGSVEFRLYAVLIAMRSTLR